MAQNDTKNCYLFNSSSLDLGNAGQCTCIFSQSSRCYVSINWCLKRNRAKFDEACPIVASQALAKDVIKLLATALRHQFAGDTVENTIRVM